MSGGISRAKLLTQRECPYEEGSPVKTHANRDPGELDVLVTCCLSEKPCIREYGCGCVEFDNWKKGEEEAYVPENGETSPVGCP